MIIYDIAIIGAGASGLMLASLLKKQNICIIDSNNEIGAKIKVSGGAKCNITNKYVSASNYLGDIDFVEPILEQLSSKELLKFCDKNGLKTIFNEKIVKGTYFCNSSKDVLSMFSKLIHEHKLILNTKVLDVTKSENFKIKTDKKSIEAKKVVVASGGISFTSLGASSIAFDIAKKFEHRVKTLNPALVGFTVQKDQFWFKNLSGISCLVKATVEGREFDGNILFAHKGITGPVILNASLYWEKGQISLDFLPNKEFNSFLKSNKKASTCFGLPKRFMAEFLSSVSLLDKAVSLYSKEELLRLKLLKEYSFAPAGNFGYTKAEVTKGGIDTSFINAYTMESLNCEDLYFLGECLNVTGELGGYNFQFAFASSFVCAKELNSCV